MCFSWPFNRFILLLYNQSVGNWNVGWSTAALKHHSVVCAQLCKSSYREWNDTYDCNILNLHLVEHSITVSRNVDQLLFLCSFCIHLSNNIHMKKLSGILFSLWKILFCFKPLFSICEWFLKCTNGIPTTTSSSVQYVMVLSIGGCKRSFCCKWCKIIHPATEWRYHYEMSPQRPVHTVTFSDWPD